MSFSPMVSATGQTLAEDVSRNVTGHCIGVPLKSKCSGTKVPEHILLGSAVRNAYFIVLPCFYIVQTNGLLQLIWFESYL